ncbi:MAG: YidC/Oxa1 family membrane protein insertase [Chloroflexi bacterium]|nr:YidC/Oxa1 family membrane protein insertase [Chloroflexota bacterium]
MPIGYVWQTFLETPLINVMVALSAICFGSFGIAILVFTVISRAVLFPLTLRTLHSMRKIQEISPKLQEIQKKYSDPRRRSEETMKLYRESGVNPLGCLGPQLVQFPIFIALYQVIRITVATTPESVVGLSNRLYDADFIQHAIPLSTSFLFVDLQANGGILLTAVVFASMWLQQRISTGRTPSTATQSAQQQQMQAMMLWMMPALFSWFVLVAPAGLGLYWASSTVIGIVLQWMFVGPGDFTWGSLVPAVVRRRLGGSPATARRPRPAFAGAGGNASNHPAEGDSEARTTDEGSGDQRQDRRRGNRPRARSTRPAPRSGRRRRHPRG